MHAATIRIILDDAQSHAQLARCRIYENPIRTYLAHTLTEVSEVCDAIEAASKEGFYIVFLGSYKLGEAFQGITQQDLETPLLKAWVFKDLKQINYDEMTAWLDAQKELEPAHIVPENRELDFQKFKSQIEKIQNYIRTGDTYQVNFTFREFGHIYGSPLQLFKNLRARQPVPFGAYVEDQDGYLISCSPEWFIKKTGAQLVTKPMKGTANRSSPLANHLADDPKNRAENLMIVDLLRNDLSKIALPGTVHVPKLFDIEEYGSVLQMTSTITAEIAPKTSLLKLLDAIFPCGSVTGAPKKRTMEIIQELENHPRKYYCGGLGYLDPSTDTMGDLCMSVLIRTLEVSPNQDYEFGVGSGITIDSDPLEEWQECQLKRKFLGSPPPWGVFETMRYENGEILRLNSHLIRLKNACEKLGIPIDLENVKDQINKTKAHWPHQTMRIKLSISPNADVLITHGDLSDLDGQQYYAWASEHLKQHTLDFRIHPLQYKTTHRDFYDLAWQKAEKIGAFDLLFTNHLGYVTEGGRSNLFVQKNNEWLTPPISAGCLPGIMREHLIKELNAKELLFKKDAVEQADQVILCNSLRGIIPVKLLNTQL